MAFINQFPYSDFHELNIDWALKNIKTLQSEMIEVQKVIADIEIQTKEQIEAMIDAAIASNNIVIAQQLQSLKNELTQSYQTYVNNQIAQLKIYLDGQDTYYYGLSKTYTDEKYVQAKQYVDDQILNYTMMINPITGVYEDVRLVVDDIVSYFHTENSLTATEYDALDLTADDYDNYELTAYDYDFNGKNLLP